MKPDLASLSARARQAVQAGEWRTVRACAAEILQNDANQSEGHFLVGLAERSSSRPAQAALAFERALELDANRYDAAIELARQYQEIGRLADSLRLLERYESRLGNSPLYLDVAGTTYSRLGLHERACPLYELANRLQPGVDLFQANLAACWVYLGKIDEAIRIYEELLERFPNHQRNHYHLSGLRTVRDARHVEKMKAVLRSTGQPPDKNIFLYYAIGKELEDLEQWDEAFHYYKMAGDAVAQVASYDIGDDLDLIDRIIKVCHAGWLAEVPAGVRKDPSIGTPIFIVGLPRTGTTLTDRILSSHSQVESAGETLFMPMALMRKSGVDSEGRMTAAVIEAAARPGIDGIGAGYLKAVAYRLSGRPMFIDKFPENFLYLGFIARDMPHARIVHLRRNPMDTCFAMYKQSFFRYAYTLEDLGRYYVAHDRLHRHWRNVLGDRLIELGYEAMVSDPERETRRLLEQLGLRFEPACLEFHRVTGPVATASAVQVREKVHTRSVGKWKRFATHLEPLRARLEAAGIEVDGV